jgi:hypothetical protein
MVHIDCDYRLEDFQSEGSQEEHIAPTNLSPVNPMAKSPRDTPNPHIFFDTTPCKDVYHGPMNFAADKHIAIDTSDAPTAKPEIYRPNIWKKFKAKWIPIGVAATLVASLFPISYATKINQDTHLPILPKRPSVERKLEVPKYETTTVYHNIARGDVLYRIAMKELEAQGNAKPGVGEINSKVAEIAFDNKIENPDYIVAGSTIKLTRVVEESAKKADNFSAYGKADKLSSYGEKPSAGVNHDGNVPKIDITEIYNKNVLKGMGVEEAYMSALMYKQHHDGMPLTEVAKLHGKTTDYVSKLVKELDI